MKNTLEIVIGSKGFGKNCKLSVEVYTGIRLDQNRQLPISDHPWVINDPKHAKDPAISSDGRILSASFFRTQWKNIILAPLESDEKKYVHPQNREVLIRTKVPIEHATFVQNVFNVKSDIEGNDFLDRRFNSQLHDASRDGALLLMRMEVGQILRLWTRDGVVSLGLEASGRIRYVFGHHLRDDFVALMESSRETAAEAEEDYKALMSIRQEAPVPPHAHIFDAVEKKLRLLEPESETFTPSQAVIVPRRKKVIPIVPRRKKALRPGDAIITAVRTNA